MFAYGAKTEGLCPYGINKYKSLNTDNSNYIFKSPFMVNIKTGMLLMYQGEFLRV